MGQKANPISLRLQINRDFDTAWYSDKSQGSYSKVLIRELQIRKYLQSLFKHLDLSSSRVIFQFYPKKLIIHSFVMDHRKMKFSPNERVDGGLRSGSPKKISARALVGLCPPNNKSLVLLLKYMLSQKDESASLFLHLFKRLLVNTNSNLGNTQKYLGTMNSPQLSTTLDEIVHIYPQKLQNKYVSAHFVAEFITRSLESNMSFREIARNIQREILGKSAGIRGLRMMCSGRLGGAEIAKVESRKFGQTSLQTFSQQVDFAHAEAYTLYGIIGVKVWLVSQDTA